MKLYVHPEFIYFIWCHVNRKKWIDGNEFLESVTRLKLGMFIMIVFCPNNLCGKEELSYFQYKILCYINDLAL